MEKATFAAGCFWGVEQAFRRVEGVVGTTVGYTGGTVANPTYEDVCTGKTGHAEAVEVVYDPARVAYDDLLRVFWETHDPTSPNRQGPDVGTQYRSAIFTHSEEQEQTAEDVIAELNDAGIWDEPIVTEVSPFEAFYPAEEYHQEYFARNPYQPYCQIVIAPKVAKFRKQYLERLKKVG